MELFNQIYNQFRSLSSSSKCQANQCPWTFFFGNKLCWYVPHDCECKSVRSWRIWFCSQMFYEIYETRKRLPRINWIEHRQTDIRKINILQMLFQIRFSAVFMTNMQHIFEQQRCACDTDQWWRGKVIQMPRFAVSIYTLIFFSFLLFLFFIINWVMSCL